MRTKSLSIISGLILSVTTAHAATTIVEDFSLPTIAYDTETYTGSIDMTSISSLNDVSIVYGGTALHSATNPFAFESDLSYHFDHEITINAYDSVGGGLLFSLSSTQYEVVQTGLSVLPGETLQVSFADSQSFSDSLSGSYGLVDIYTVISGSYGTFGDDFINTFDGIEDVTLSIQANGVPEPSSALLLGVAGLGLLIRRQR